MDQACDALEAAVERASTTWALVVLVVVWWLLKLGRDALVARAAEVAKVGEVARVAERLARLEADAEVRLVRLENHYRGR